MTRSLIACTLLWLSAMLGLAAPRNVGDASEYVGMALSLSRLRPPALSDAELRAFTQRFADTPARFELESRRIPELLGPDGRYDMPHMWVYPLLAVPGVWVARLLGVSPAWGFVGLNIALLAGLLTLAFRRGAGPWTLVLVASPLVWWLDKPLADPFIACALGAAALLWPTHGPVSLALLGVATAQNPALAVACVIFAGCAVAESPARLRDRRWWAGALAGAACAAIGPAYSFWRLGRLSPLTSYVEASWPTLTSLLFPLTDVNMGALVRFPVGALVVALALCRRTGWSSPGALPAALTAAALLAVISQQPNMNQGGNPDLSRYAVWLLPLALPWLLAADRSPRPMMRGGGVLLLAVSAAWTAIAFLPTRPESYRYPTTLAQWMWTGHPSWSAPRPEAFAERTSHREPAIVPTSTRGCEKVLLYEGTWPAPCPPGYAEVPTACHQPRTYCYADAYGFGMHTVRYVGELPSWLPVVHDRTWRAGDPHTSWVAGVIEGLRSGAPPEPRLSVRAASHVGWTQTWWSDEGRLVVYARHAAEGARLALRHAGRATVTVRTPDRGEEPRQVDPAEAPTIVALPAGPHVVVEVRVE